MKTIFETTWTCDYCGNPNFHSDIVCRHCGAAKPSRYQKMLRGCKARLIVFKRLFQSWARACLKNAFCQMYFTICGRFAPNEGRIAGYVT